MGIETACFVSGQRETQQHGLEALVLFTCLCCCPFYEFGVWGGRKFPVRAVEAVGTGGTVMLVVSSGLCIRASIAVRICVDADSSCSSLPTYPPLFLSFLLFMSSVASDSLNSLGMCDVIST